MISEIGLKVCATTAGIKRYRSIIIKKEEETCITNKWVSLAKAKLNSIEALISKALMDSNISHDEFVLIKRMWQYERRNQKFKDLNSLSKIFSF